MMGCLKAFRGRYRFSSLRCYFADFWVGLLSVVSTKFQRMYKQVWSTNRCVLSTFLDASSHLYKRVCPSVGPSVRRSVGRSVRNQLFSKSKNEGFSSCISSGKPTNITNIELHLYRKVCLLVRPSVRVKSRNKSSK